MFRPTLVLLTLLTGSAAAQSNPRGTNSNTNEYSVRPLTAEPRTAFDLKVKYRDSGAIVASGNVIVTGNINGKGGTFGYDAAKGKLLWSVKGHMRGEPAIDGTAAYAVNDAGGGTFRLAKLNLKTGKALWSVSGKDLGNHEAAPLVADGRVLLVHNSGDVAAYDAATGKSIWTLPATRTCSPVLALGKGVVIFAGMLGTEDMKTLHGLDPATGKVLWSTSVAKRDCPNAPAIADGRVLVRTYNNLFAFDATTGALAWKYEHVVTVNGRKEIRNLRAVTVSKGVVYTSTQSAILGFDLAKGTPVFDLPFELPSDSHDVRMPIAGGVLYVSGNAELPRETGMGGGWVYAIDLATKKVLWRFHASKPDGYGNKQGTWTTRYILPVDDGVIVESEQRLVKLVAP